MTLSHGNSYSCLDLGVSKLEPEPKLTGWFNFLTKMVRLSHSIKNQIFSAKVRIQTEPAECSPPLTWIKHQHYRIRVWTQI